jgi:hypothetical protein
MDGAMNGRPKRPRELFSDPAPVLNRAIDRAEEWGCERKRVYESMDDARQGIPATQAIYRCPFADHWHRTTRRASA